MEALDEIAIGIVETGDLASWIALGRTMRSDYPGLETEQSLADNRGTLEKNMERRKRWRSSCGWPSFFQEREYAQCPGG